MKAEIVDVCELWVYFLTYGKASRSCSSQQFSGLFGGGGDVQFIKSSQYDAIRAIINIKAIIVEVPALDSDQCDQL